MSNALALESSPYLLQHRDNPVDWLAWGDVALARSRDEDKPLLVSIGYSACHWCHVMERESFEDAEVAALMNEHFVCVKVDREERPDVDAIYMEAVQTLTGHGGWPLNVFLTPDQTPFYGGTYFPPQARHGLPAWRDVVYSMARAWDEQREDIAEIAGQLESRLRAAATPAARPAEIEAHLLDDAVRNLATTYDQDFGGFGGAPKFPPSNSLGFLLAQSVAGSSWAEKAGEMAAHTLTQMAVGGICDQTGGGFARYAVDRTWTVPHFEKMLYDNALLLRVYTQGFLATGDSLFRDTAIAIAEWALREMRGPEGAFMSALDADSEGVEGLFYTWTRDELDEALGELRDDALTWLTTAPFEGRLIVEARGARDAVSASTRGEVRARLLAARAGRVQPGTDTKRLAAWNGLMIGALAYGGAALGRPDWTGAAAEAAAFVCESMRDDAGRLLRTSDGAAAKLNGYLEDHAFMAEGLLDLYEATFEPRWFNAARELCDQTIERFADDEHGGFFATSSDHEALLVRRKDLEDNPIPAGSSSAALALLRMAALTGVAEYERRADGALALVAEIAPRYPAGFGHALLGLDFRARPVREVALAGEDVAELAAVVRSELRPGLVLAGPPGDDVPLMRSRAALGGAATAYVCERFACQAPVTDPGDLARLLSGRG